MSAGVEWQGLEAFKAALLALPEDLASDAGPIVLDHATAAAATVRAAYPTRGTGNLAKGVKILKGATADRYGAAARVKNTSPHAWIYEYGSALRRYRGASRGRMPASHVFVKTMIKERRGMYRDLMGMMERHGLEVSGGGGLL